MRPKPSEIIAGIRAILADTIAPELTGDHARSRLAEIRAVLAQVDWDDAAFTLKRRATGLAVALRDALQWVDRLPDPPAQESFDAYLDYWEALGACAIGALDRLNVHLDDRPDDTDAWSCRHRILAAL
ncbi:hypothetical protein QWI29_22160 [Mycolicibacterium neoaurum]|uniref:hypothetical protein n=1 Tax=Mycolicibacterium neoaurum TaxID=1795 RepID=UPI0026729C01|nr:hypothetical protein [Mycolicibacterium neoaurum]MDO3402754.1 hypothetical protein [Mycolicibacterium neoaurum]